MKDDPNAHGGFKGKNNQGGNDDEGGQLAKGVGNEAINAVLPLFLFREHWDIARRRAPPLFGLACTLDVMGYVPA